MKRLSDLMYCFPFALARFVIYITLAAYYFYLRYFSGFHCALAPCALCGMTTATHHLFIFRWDLAFCENPLVVFVLAAVAFILVDLSAFVVRLVKKTLSIPQ